MNFILSLSKRVVLGISVALIIASSFLSNAAPAEAATYKVKMGSDSFQLAFEPRKLKAAPGDTIEFINNKMAPHNIVFKDEPFKSLAMKSNKLLYQAGENYAITIPSDTPAGKYTFYCTPHQGAGMKGKLVVE